MILWVESLMSFPVLMQLRQQNAANQSSGSQASGGPPGKGEQPKHEPQY